MLKGISLTGWSGAVKVFGRIWSEDEYYEEITAPISEVLPPLPPDIEAKMGQALAGLVRVFANPRPSKPGRHPLCPGMLSYDMVRKRDGSIAFLPSMGDVLVSKSLRNVSGR